jgi:hypothetical protein
MSFPLSPTDGQTTSLSGVVYSFNTSTQAWTRVAQYVTATINLTISGSTPSNSVNSGALRVVGGVGVGENMNVGGIITATNIYVGPYPVSTASALSIQYNGAAIGTAKTFNFSTGTTASLANSVITVSVLPGQFKPNIFSINNTSTIVVDVNTVDQCNIIGLTTDTNISVTYSIKVPNDGQRMLFRIRDDSTARNLSWSTDPGQFRTIGISFPTITSPSKLAYVGCIYNAIDGYWDLISSLQQP